MAIMRKWVSLAFLGMMLACAWPMFSTNASAGDPLTIGYNWNVTVKDASGGQAGYDWWYGDTDTVEGWNIDTMWAYASVKTVSPVSGARFWAGVYKEIRVADGVSGTCTAKMTGTYKGQVYISEWVPFVAYAELIWSFRLIDLNGVYPNNIISEVVVDAVNRGVYGSETISDSFTETISWYVDGVNNANKRYGLEAHVTAHAESYIATNWPGAANANAYLLNNKFRGIWYSSIQVLGPYRGGCVAEGTEVTMADGSTRPVEKIDVGDQVLGYDPVTRSYVTETVGMVTSAKAPVILNINDGALRTTLDDQPIYVKNSTTEGWILNPAQIQVGWQLFDVENGAWVTVASIDYELQKTKVYDFQTDGPGTYLGNGYLLLDKPRK